MRCRTESASRVGLLLLVVAVVTPSAPARGADAAAVARANNVFALDLHAALRERPGNLFFSPYSISTALAMTREGARGETAAQMSEVLHAGGVSPEDHAALARALRPGQVSDGRGEEAQQVPAYRLHVANALWVQEGLALEGELERSLEQDFGAPPRRLDFRRSEEARRTINDWVAERTEGRIEDLVPPGMPEPATRLALANALWFQAAWSVPFSEAATRTGEFTTGEGGAVEARFMRRTDRFRYHQDDRVQVVEILYRGDETSMVVVLPRQRGGLPAVEATLDADTLDLWLDALASRRVALELPRFEIRQTAELAATLAAMGMPAAFDPATADFSGITRSEPLAIGAVLHEGFVAVDEAGTEAAAATVVTMMRATALAEEPVPFVADHPFLFLIRHRESGCILFLGRLTSPGA